MHWCHQCRKYNSGWPLRCRYCGAGLAGRLCPRNHVNPPDARLAFCGDCGQPLQRTWGAGFSIRPYLLALFIVIATLVLSGLVLSFSTEVPMLSMLLVLIMLIVGFRLALQILPPSVRNLIGFLFKGVANAVYMIFFGTGNKGRP